MSAYSDAVLADTPALYWRLGAGGGNDQTANNRDGAGQGGVTIGGASSLLLTDTADAATDFDGTDDTVDATGYNPFSGTVTVEGWAWRDTSSGTDALFGGTGDPVPFMRLDSGTNDVTVTLNNNDSWQTYTSAWPGNAQSVHWVFIGNPSGLTIDLYLNGSFTGQKSGFSLGWGTGGIFQIGARAGASDPFDGKIDEVAVYASALSSGRISAHYTAGTVDPWVPEEDSTATVRTVASGLRAR